MRNESYSLVVKCKANLYNFKNENQNNLWLYFIYKKMTITNRELGKEMNNNLPLITLELWIG